MEGGYISKDDAKVVACYVLELSGRECPHPYPKDKATGYFSSVCAGCHGNDGKGINGTYPDLTKKEYVGFK
jgi:cytochrome c553